MDKLYTCAELSARYGVSIFTVWDWIKKEKLPAIKIGREYRIKQGDLMQFENERSTSNKEKQ